MAEGFLHDDEFSGFEGLVDQGLVRHRLGRVGAGDPHRLDLAGLERLKEFDGALAGGFRHAVDAPQGGDFGAMGRVGHVPVGGEQVCEASHFAAAHGVGLAGEGEGAGAGFADLSGGQVQVDECRVVVGTKRELVEPLAVHRHCCR